MMDVDGGKIKKVVITWWPCAGKTTWMASVVQKVSQMWWNVLVVPEAARELISAWIIPWKTVSLLDFQDLVIKKQLAQEDLYERAARYAMSQSTHWKQNQLILHDRGLMDWAAYVDPEDFDDILYKNNLDRGKILQDIYDSIIFLDSAAEWAEEFYTKDEERFESPEVARENNAILKQVYIWWEKVRFQHNRQQFDKKIAAATHDVISTIWLPVPLEIENKYAVKSIDMQFLKKHKSPISHIKQFYINTPQDQGIHRARKLVQWLFTWYFHTIKWPQKFAEKERKLVSSEYEQYEKLKASNTDIIVKDRHYLLYDDQYFSFDAFVYPKHRLAPWDKGILEIEKTYEDQEVRIPSFMEVEEVTDKRQYSNAAIAGYKKVS